MNITTAEERTASLNISVKNFESQAPVDYKPYKEPVKDGDDSRLGCGKDPAIDSTQDDDRSEESPDGFFECRPYFIPGSPSFPFPPVFFCDEKRRDDEKHSRDDSRNNAGSKESRDGGIGDHPVDDEGNARGNDDCKGACGCDEGCGVTLIIAHHYHGRIKDCPEGSRVCRSDPASRKNDSNDDRHNRKPAGDGSNQETDQMDEPLGNTAPVQKKSCQYEEGKGEELKFRHAGIEVGRKDHDPKMVFQDEESGGKPEGRCNGNPEEEEKEKDGKE